MHLGSIRTLLTQHNSFLLLIHHTPDGDAVASSLALYIALRSLGKTVEVVCVDPIPVQFQFLPWSNKIRQELPCNEPLDVTITLDCGDSKRTGFRTELKKWIKTKNRRF